MTIRKTLRDAYKYLVDLSPKVIKGVRQVPEQPPLVNGYPWICRNCRRWYHHECKGTVGPDTCACTCQKGR